MRSAAMALFLHSNGMAGHGDATGSVEPASMGLE